MSESLRDLVVSLSLDASQFDKNIRLIGNELKKTESEFKLAAAGAENFEKSLKGMKTRAEALKKQLSGQNAIIEQYQGKLAKTNEKLTTARFRHEQLTKQLEEATRARDENNRKLTQAQAALRTLSKAYGANSDEARRAAEALIEQEQAFQASEDTVGKLSGQLAAVEKNVRRAYTTLTNTETALNKTNAEIEEMEAELGKLESGWYRGGVAMQEFADSLTSASRSIERVGDGLTKTVTTPMIGLGAAAAKASIDFESAFAGVRKTVTYTGEDAEAFFEGLSEGVIDMSKRLATGANDISEVMAIAGQLGIANGELEDFTETIIRLGMSTDMAGEDAASSMARFANITGMAQDQFGKMGATLVYLGNNFATTESEIMSMAVRIAAAGDQVGLSESQILGFAAALSSLGLEAEAGGSAFSKALKKMETAVATGSDALTDFAKVAGLTREEFGALWKENPAEAFEAFIVGLSKMDESGIGAIATLDEIGITELRLSDTLLRTANATELLTNAQSAANTAWAEGTALIKESDTRLATTASRIENIKNKLVATGISFGETMTPEIERLVNSLDGAVEWLGELDEGTRRNIVNFGLWAAAAGPVIKTSGTVGSAVGGTVNAFGKLAEGIGKANAAFKATGSAAQWLTTLLTPGGTLMLGLGAAAAAIAGIIALYNRAEAAKPDLSIDTSEIEKYKIDVEALQANIDVNTTTNITGDILKLKEKFIGILNDGLPETQEIRDSMQADVDSAVGEVYKLIEESYNQKKAELDAQLSEGMIDEETYNRAVSTLSTQADTLKSDLSTKADAVSAYITTLCEQNRQMTDEEIAALNSLLETLGLATEKAEQAMSAEMQSYQMAYDKTRMGMGTEDDANRAAEYIELKAQQEIDRIEAEKKALEATYAATTEGLSDSEKAAEFEKLNAGLAQLDEEIDQVYQNKERMQGGLLEGILEGGGMSVEELQRYLDILAKLDEWGIEPEGGISLAERFAAWMVSNDQVADLDGMLAELDAFAKKAEESGLFDEGSIIDKILATNYSQGRLEEGALSSTESVLKAISELVTGAKEAIEKGTPEAEEAAKTASEKVHTAAEENADGYSIGTDMMSGVARGITDGAGSTAAAMRRAMSRIKAVAKDSMDIHSPSRVMKKEVGAQMMKGVGAGFTEELGKQEKLMANAMKHMAGEIQYGAESGSTDNSRTYNSESNISFAGANFYVNDRQDIQSLATEIAGLTRTQQRGRGVRMA